MNRSTMRFPATSRASQHIVSPTSRCILDDADGDIAALVYDRKDRPDIVLCDFARRLRGEGRQVCGLVQLRDRDSVDPCRRLVALDDWRMLDVPRTASDADARRYHIDGRRIDHIARRIEAEITRGADMVVASRFGPLELAGRGFCRVIRLASQTQTPLVIAVPSSGFDGWIRVSGGMTVKLGCKLRDILAWWNSLVRSRPLARRPQICELVK